VLIVGCYQLLLEVYNEKEDPAPDYYMPSIDTCCHTDISLFCGYKNYPNINVDNNVGKYNDSYYTCPGGNGGYYTCPGGGGGYYTCPGSYGGYYTCPGGDDGYYTCPGGGGGYYTCPGGDDGYYTCPGSYGGYYANANNNSNSCSVIHR